MKVYTKTGDRGTTCLIGGERVPKWDLRVEAYGTVDELAAQLAMLEDMMSDNGGFGDLPQWLENIQSDLMYVEAMLAVGKGGEDKVSAQPEVSVGRLEQQIDIMSEGMEPVTKFIIPGGHRIVSQTHICRTVCRRAERAVAALSNQYPTTPLPGEYLNRLSDWLYVVGRKAVETLSVRERSWIP